MMVLLKTARFLTCTALCSTLFLAEAVAKGYPTNTARMQAMDKITGRVSEIDVPVNGEVQFGSFSIVVRKCTTRSPEETPENTAFVDVVDNYNGDSPVNIFKGWMFSSSPALNAVEHPIYDVWLLRCYDADLKDKKLLSQEELLARDDIPKATPKESPLKKDIEAKEAASNPVVAEQPAQQTQEVVDEEKTAEGEAIEVSAEISLDTLPAQEDGAPKMLLQLTTPDKHSDVKDNDVQETQESELEQISPELEQAPLSSSEDTASESSEDASTEDVETEYYDDAENAFESDE